MSSAKSRVETNAYVSLYTSLGMTEGYKTNLASLQPPPYNGGAAIPPCTENDDAKFFIVVKGANGKESQVGSADPKSTNVFFDSVANAFIFPSSEAWNAKFPKWLKDQCNSTTCTLKTVSSVTRTENGSDQFFNLVINDQNKLKVNLTNGSWVSGCGVYTVNRMQATITDFNNAKQIFGENFWHRQTQVVLALKNAFYNIGELKSHNKKRAEFINRMITENQKEADKYVKVKQALNEAIAALNGQIDAVRTLISVTTSRKARCTSEYQNLNLQIITEEKRIAAKKVEIATNLAAAKLKKKIYLKGLFYWIEASFFYRVFAERLVKDEAALDAATLTPTALKATQGKITNAFYPVPVTFAELSAK